MILETYARCHAVLYKGYIEGSHKRTTKLMLFRSLPEAFKFFQERQADNTAIQLFIEPEMVGGDFISLALGENDL